MVDDMGSIEHVCLDRVPHLDFLQLGRVSDLSELKIRSIALPTSQTVNQRLLEPPRHQSSDQPVGVASTSTGWHLK